MNPQNTESESKLSYVQYKLIPKTPVLEIVAEPSSIKHHLPRWKKCMNCKFFLSFFIYYISNRTLKIKVCVTCDFTLLQL